MEVEHVEGEQRFVARTEVGEAELSYRTPREGVLDLVHTFVPTDERGQGVGDALVQRVLGHARENGLKVIPSCPFVARWLDAHPGHADVVVSA